MTRTYALEDEKGNVVAQGSYEACRAASRLMFGTSHIVSRWVRDMANLMVGSVRERLTYTSFARRALGLK